jgi:hypothetical protein
MHRLIAGSSALFKRSAMGYAPELHSDWSIRARMGHTGYDRNTTATRLLLCSFPNPIAPLHPPFPLTSLCHPSASNSSNPPPSPHHSLDLVNQCSTQAKPVTLWWSRHFGCWCALVDFQSGAGKGGGGANSMPVWMPFCETEGKVSCFARLLVGDAAPVEEKEWRRGNEKRDNEKKARETRDDDGG